MLFGQQNGGQDEVRVIDDDLDSLGKFIRSDATTLELATGVTRIDNTFQPKNFNIFQKSNITKNNNVNRNNVQSGVYKCVLGCENPHRLIEGDIYLNWNVLNRRDFVKKIITMLCMLGYIPYCPKLAEKERRM